MFSNFIYRLNNLNNNNFIKAFCLLRKAQRQRFNNFVQSPYFNQQKELIELTNYLITVEQDDVSKFERTRLWESVWPDRVFHLPKLRYYLSDLMQLIRRFLLLEKEQNPFEHQFELSQIVRELDDAKWYQKEWSVTTKRLEELSIRDASYFNHAYQYFFEQQDYLSQQSRKGYTYLPKAREALTSYYMISMLKMACLSVESVSTGSSSNEDLLQAVLSIVENQLDGQPPALLVYYHAYRMLHGVDTTLHFEALVKQLTNNNEIFTKKDLQDLYLLAINFCIRQLNTGQKEYIQHAFDLYDQGLENGALLANGYLTVFNYKNVIRLGIALRQIAWVEQFMEKYKNDLPPDERENTYLYNLSYYYFKKPDYDQAMELLRQVKFKDVYNNLDARRMLLKIYYEQGDWIALDALLDSFKAYVMRQKNIAYHRAGNLNLIKVVRFMVKADTTQKIIKLKKRMETYNNLAEKGWIEKMLENK